MLIKCPECKAEISNKAPSCPQCGAPIASLLDAAVARVAVEGASKAGNRFCTVCGSITKPIRITKGSFVIEVFLWLCFLFPGLIYSLWRLTTRHDACRSCKSAAIVPLNSPAARLASARPTG